MSASTRNSVVAKDVIDIVSSYQLPWKLLQNKTVLITGASGFLPAYMVETLLYLNEVQDLNVTILALVRNRAGYVQRFPHAAARSDLICIEQDISKFDPQGIHADYIVHAASQASPKYYSVDPIGTLSANTVGTAALLDLAVSCRSEGFLFFSSGEVYGDAKTIPTGEEDFGSLNPVSVRSCYAESKRMGENMCVSWWHQLGVPATIVRPFHTYGPLMRLDDGRVYADFIANILRNEPIVLKSEGNALRAFCYIADAVAGFWTVLLKGAAGQAYNVGNPGGEISIRGLAEMLVDLYPEKNLRVISDFRTDDSTYLASPLLRNCPDISKIGALGWGPVMSLQDGFRKTIESYL